MGERLVITFNRNDEPFAAMYFHWSAYSIPAAFILKEISNYYLPQITGADNNLSQLKLIRFAEKMYADGYSDGVSYAQEQKAKSEMINAAPDGVREILSSIYETHGGVCGADRQLVESKWPDEVFLDDVNRNTGLVAISKEEIESMISCAQMLISINLDNMSILNGSIYQYTLEEYMDETVEDEDFIYPNDLPRSPVDLTEFNCDEAECVYEVLNGAQYCWIRHEDTCYQIIHG